MSSFNFLDLFTGGSSTPPPVATRKAPGPPAAPVLTREQVVLNRIQEECAKQEKLKQGYLNQHARLYADARKAAATDRERAKDLLQQSDAAKASADRLSGQIADKKAQIASYERMSSVAAHVVTTREMQNMMQDLRQQLDVDGFEEARDALHETVTELDDVERLFEIPIGATGEAAQMTPNQRAQSLDNRLDDLLSGETMTALDEMPSAASLPALPVPTPVAASQPDRVARVAEAAGVPVDKRSEIAKRLAGARGNARKPVQ